MWQSTQTAPNAGSRTAAGTSRRAKNSAPAAPKGQHRAAHHEQDDAGGLGDFLNDLDALDFRIRWRGSGDDHAQPIAGTVDRDRAEAVVISGLPRGVVGGRSDNHRARWLQREVGSNADLIY